MTMHTKRKQQPAMNFSSAVPYLFFLALIFYFNCVERSLMSPLLVSIQKEFQFSYALTTSLLVVRSFGLSISLFCNSFLATHFTHRSIVTASVFLAGASFSLLSLTTSYFQLQLGLLLFGLSAGMYFPSGMASIASLVQCKDYGKAISIHELAPNLAFITAPFIVELLLIITDWRGCLRYVGLALNVTGLRFCPLWERRGRQRDTTAICNAQATGDQTQSLDIFSSSRHHPFAGNCPILCPATLSGRSA